jgi:hypothetical protein
MNTQYSQPTISHSPLAEMPVSKKFKLNPFVTLALAIIFSITFVNLPFDGQFRREFVDLDVYKSLFGHNSDENILSSYDGASLLDYFTNEYLWNFVIINLRNILGSSDSALACISIFCCAIYFLAMSRMSNIYHAVIVMFHPIMILFIMSQLRSAFAISLVYLALVELQFWKKAYLEEDNSTSTSFWIWTIIASQVILLLSSCFVHSSMAIILFSLLVSVVSSWLTKNQHCKTALLIVSILILSIVFSISLLRYQLLSAIGDRRAIYQDGSSGTLEILAWIPFVIYGYFRFSKTLIDPLWTFSIICVAVFLLSSLLGMMSSRFLLFAFPAIIYSIYSLQKDRILLFTWFYSLQFLYIFYHILR